MASQRGFETQYSLKTPKQVDYCIAIRSPAWRSFHNY